MPFTNKLINETSPYLLQHAHNPVNWYPWGEEAFNKAVKENKPVLVSIGYAACHWCHVMERESFEDESTAVLMNEHFVSIKIDREERPDLDHIYMDALQALTGSGGWPLHVFLTPGRKPFYGGTYFPPQQAYNRPSWKETLINISQAFKDKRNEIDAQAENLTEHLIKSNTFGFQIKEKSDEVFTKKKIQEAVENMMKSADKEWGGFGRSPKFPQTFSIQFLLRYHHITGNSETKEQALLSLDKMIEGGIYDQIGGGFARYSTDTEWLAPHFEKMLYDNALFVSVLSEAYQLTGYERYKEVIIETINFVKTELLQSQKGFFSSLDADSEGIEGKFYVWTMDEVKKIMGNEAAIFCEYYDITETGNWEGKNICRVKMPVEKFAGTKQISTAGLKKILLTGKNKLVAERSKRSRPLLDDKIILGWNGLMNTACSKAYAATGIHEFRNLAIENMEFILSVFSAGEKNGFHHTWKNDQAKYPAFLDDYAYLIEALLSLQEITSQSKWLDKAVLITNYVIEHFSEDETGFFFYTPFGQKDVIVRKKEIYDGAIPSGNSVMAKNLLNLGILMDKIEWKNRAINMTSSIHKAVISYPASFGNWACQLLEIVEGTNEIILIGPGIESLKNEILKLYIPHRVFMASETAKTAYPLLAGKGVTNKSAIYLCRNNTCKAPVFSAEDLISLINRPKKE